MAEIKTKPTSENVNDFLNKIENEQKRKDSFEILEIMKNASGKEPQIWGTSIIGFDNIKFRSPNTGREVDWFIIGFAPRKANISLYLGMDVQKYAEYLKKLGKHKTGVGCLYINKLSDVDITVLSEMINEAVKK
ncbi:MAG: DUF1801 domain-containing protein [Bacteroidales bacterium]|jgi:hypothetical protein|nr:DUF1801 domain-containing protein [Bacteroidales bacterium]